MNPAPQTYIRHSGTKTRGSYITSDPRFALEEVGDSVPQGYSRPGISAGSTAAWSSQSSSLTGQTSSNRFRRSSIWILERIKISSSQLVYLSLSPSSALPRHSIKRAWSARQHWQLCLTSLFEMTYKSIPRVLRAQISNKRLDLHWFSTVITNRTIEQPSPPVIIRSVTLDSLNLWLSYILLHPLFTICLTPHPVSLGRRRTAVLRLQPDTPLPSSAIYTDN